MGGVTTSKDFLTKNAYQSRYAGDPGFGSTPNGGSAPVGWGNGIVGIVTAKSDKDITIKAEGESEAKRYLLASKDGGGPSADVQAALKMVFVTNIVIFQRQGEQDPVLTAIQPLHSKTRLGMVTGTVVAVDPAANTPSLDVKPSGQGFIERYVPRWDVAAKAALAADVGTPRNDPSPRIG